MMNIKYFNKTYSIEEGTYSYYYVVFCLQVVLIVFVILYYLLNVYIDIRTKQYVTNIQRLHHSIYLPCIAGHVMCMLQKILLIISSDAGENLDNPIFYTISLIRAFSCFPGFYCLSAFVAERCFATYWLDDYERNQRGWLVPLILCVIYAIATVSAYNFHHASNTFPYVIVFITLSCLASLVNNINFRLNRDYYFRSQRFDGGGYSLAQRFQISENIKFAFFFNQFAQSIAFFQIVGSLCLLVDNLDISRSWKNLSTVIFDTAMPLYAVVTPYVVYYHNPKYHEELHNIMNLLRHNHQVKPTGSDILKSVRIQDTFGNQLVFDNSQRTSTYFNQLNVSWK